jgi:putative oxidoreductase
LRNVVSRLSHFRRLTSGTMLLRMTRTMTDDSFVASRALASDRPNTALRTLLTRLIQTSDSFAPTVARVGLGTIMFAHGAQKVFGWFGGSGFSTTLASFTVKQGIPLPFALAAILGESLGALALVTGVLSRVAAAWIAVIMVVAVAMVHLKFGFFMNWGGKHPGEGFEYHLLALALAGVVMIAGGGAASVDRWLMQRSARR